jgi:hypothetical protein
MRNGHISRRGRSGEHTSWAPTLERIGPHEWKFPESVWEISERFHIPSDLVVAYVSAQRKPPDVRICRLRNQSCVGNRPPSTSTPH